jgi:hypothetical protein
MLFNYFETILKANLNRSIASSIFRLSPHLDNTQKYLLRARAMFGCFAQLK